MHMHSVYGVLVWPCQNSKSQHHNNKRTTTNNNNKNKYQIELSSISYTFKTISQSTT